MAFGEDDDRGVGQADLEIRVAAHNRRRLFDVGPTELGELVSALGDLTQKRQLLALTVPLAKQVIQLGEDERREEKRTAHLIDDPLYLVMMRRR